MILLTVAIIVCLAAGTATGQTVKRIEAGGSIGAIDFRESLHEKPFAFTARLGYRFSSVLGIEATVTHCPQDPANNYGQTIFAIGPRVGVRYRALHAFARTQAGMLRIGGGAFKAWNGVRNEPAFDVGGGIELEMTSWAAFRIDSSVLIVPYGDTPVRGPLPPYSETLGVTRSRGGSAGLQFRF
jgi:hypothetical protein